MRTIKNDNHKRIAIAAPRGHSKSTLVNLIYLLWVIVHVKTRFVIIVSDTYSQSTLFLETIRTELESNDKLIAFYGIKIEKSNEGEIVANGIMIKAIGAGMKVRGLKYQESRPTLVIIDDLENDELVENKQRRDKLERWFNGALIPSMSSNGRVIMIGTILHYDSLLNKILMTEGYKEYTRLRYSAIQESGEALWHEHMSIERLNELKAEYTAKGQSYLFYQEYMNNPTTDENRKFKIEKTKFYEEAELDKKQLLTYITLDRAYSTQKTADFTGVIVVSVDIENNWYIRTAKRFKGDEKELIDEIFDLYSYWRPRIMGIEQKAYEYTLKKWIEDEMRRRNQFFVIEPLHDGGAAKIKRIEGLLPRYLSGSIYFKRDQTDLLDELYTFPFSVYDDLSDALAYMINLANKPSSNLNKIKKQARPMTRYGA